MMLAAGQALSQWPAMGLSLVNVSVELVQEVLRPAAPVLRRATLLT
jgi:hypothetical protein